MAWSCSCEFDDRYDRLWWWGNLFSAEWHRRHRAHHLAVFPDVDVSTRCNLDMFVAMAESAEVPRDA